MHQSHSVQSDIIAVERVSSSCDSLVITVRTGGKKEGLFVPCVIGYYQGGHDQFVITLLEVPKAALLHTCHQNCVIVTWVKNSQERVEGCELLFAKVPTSTCVALLHFVSITYILAVFKDSPAQSIQAVAMEYES